MHHPRYQLPTRDDCRPRCEQRTAIPPSVPASAAAWALSGGGPCGAPSCDRRRRRTCVGRAQASARPGHEAS
eukprot:6692986-Alexandrium_andersonii.AAC.1